MVPLERAPRPPRTVASRGRALAIALSALAACRTAGPATTTDSGLDAAVRDGAADGRSDSDLEDDGGADADSAPPLDGDVAPPRPASLERYLTGDPEDATAPPAGPALLAIGGGPEPVEAFRRWVGALSGGDAVVLRASGADGYNGFLYDEVGGVDSVETLLVTSRELAEDPYVAWTISRAEGIYIAGGDQERYMTLWKGTALSRAVDAAWRRGASVGGTSAGLAVLSEQVFAAYRGSVNSAEALGDPYDERVTLDSGPFSIPVLASSLFDSHFRERDRMGRLIAFLARLRTDGYGGEPVGIGVDAGTALYVDPSGRGEVIGTSAVYVVRLAAPPGRCAPGAALEAEAEVWRLSSGDALLLPAPEPGHAAYRVTASRGALSPADPY